jgi:hypothetical protein
MSIGLKTGSLVGKCIFCQNRIHQDQENIASKFSFVHNAKWFCGDCVMGMADRVAELNVLAVKWVKMCEAIDSNPDEDYAINIKTGKLVRIPK